MFFRYLLIKSFNKRLAEEIKKDLIISLRKKGISVSKIQIALNSHVLSISVYMNDELHNAI